MERSGLFHKARRIVVKVGTSSITEELTLSERKLGKIVEEVARLRKGGREVVVVSSGAIAAGIGTLALRERPRDIEMLQAVAAIGQSELMKAYSGVFGRAGLKVAQILLTRDDFNSRSRFLRIRNTINKLLKLGVVPIINENDTVAIDEIRFGDNDTLSALVSSAIGADLLIMLSNMDGLYTRDPARSKNAVKIEVIDGVCDVISSIKGKSRLGGVGGIESKVRAGRMMMNCGIPMAIVNSMTEDVIARLLGGERLGTIFLPKRRLGGKTRWVLYSSKPKGTIWVDAGAARIVSGGKASLLPSGITRIDGTFRKGDSVSISDSDGVEFARGISNFASDDLRRIIGRRTNEIEGILGGKTQKEAVHHDNLVLTGDKS